MWDSLLWWAVAGGSELDLCLMEKQPARLAAKKDMEIIFSIKYITHRKQSVCILLPVV